MLNEFHKIAITVAVLIIAASIAHYFIIALPKHNASIMQFEKQKYEEQQAYQEQRDDDERIERARKDIEAIGKREILNLCLDSADESSEKYILLNGGEKKENGAITAPRYVLAEAANMKKAAKDECHRRYK